jgi:DNA-binding protein H-NS
MNDITSVINRLSGQATDRLNDAKSIIAEARKTVDDTSELTDELADLKKSETPQPAEVKKEKINAVNNSAEKKVQLEELKPAASSAPENKNSKKANFSFDMSDILKAAEKDAAASETVEETKPVEQPAPETKPSKAANFNFDMSELLKAAEEEAANNPES